MKHPRWTFFIAAILLYVTLDLSVPTIPGAFVFDASDSVESTQSKRARGAGEVVVGPPWAREALVVRPPRVAVSHRLTATVEAVAIRPSLVTWRPRTALDLPPLCEDPH